MDGLPPLRGPGEEAVAPARNGTALFAMRCDRAALRRAKNLPAAHGAGIRRALSVMGIMSGYQAVPVIGRHRMAGYQNTPVLGGVPPQLSGRPAQLQGFRVNGYRPTGSGVMGGIGAIAEGAGSGITNSGGGGYMG